MSASRSSIEGDIRALRQAVAVRGGFRRCPGRTTTKFALHAIAGCALYVACLVLPVQAAIALMPVCAMVLVVGVMMGHEGVHGAAFRSRRANSLLSLLAFPLLSGLSCTFWRHKHNVLHHNHPNSVHLDQDLEVLPFAISLAHHRNSNCLCQWIQRRVQRGWLFWLLSPLLPWDLRWRGSRYVIARALGPDPKAEILLDAMMMVAHVIVFVVTPAVLLGPMRAIGMYLGVWAVAGSWLALVGLVAHSACPVIDRCDDRWAQQFHTTRNLRLNGVLSWCFVGLDFQIEHHLFPQISHFLLPQIVPLVRAFARDHSLPYREAGLRECVREITGYFDRAWLDEAIDLLNVEPFSEGRRSDADARAALRA